MSTGTVVCTIIGMFLTIVLMVAAFVVAACEYFTREPNWPRATFYLVASLCFQSALWRKINKCLKTVDEKAP